MNTANLTNKDYCWDEWNFSLKTHVTLANQTAPRLSDSVGNVKLLSKNCGKNESHINYCHSHCMDKTVENALVQASMNTEGTFESIWDAAEDGMKAIGKSDWPLFMIIPFEVNSGVDFQYYDDMNFCVIDILYTLARNENEPGGWPFRSFFMTHKTVPLN